MIIWLNSTVGAGKTSIGQALSHILPGAVFMDGDDHAGPSSLPNTVRWRMAIDALLRAAARRSRTLVVAYPLDRLEYQRLKAVCRRGRRSLVLVNLATPLTITLRGRGSRRLDAAEQARVREMRSKGFHRRPFASATFSNASSPPRTTARKIITRLHLTK